MSRVPNATLVNQIYDGNSPSAILLSGTAKVYCVFNEAYADAVDNYPVVSVAGKTGAVTLDKTDVSLDNVDNVSDANKPVSTAQQTAIDTAVDDAEFTGSSVVSSRSITAAPNTPNTCLLYTSDAADE